MDRDSIAAVVDANLETVEQGLQFLSELPGAAYVARHEPIAGSTIGEHFRHVLDMYHVVLNGWQTGNIDYNQRRRGALVESNPDIARCELKDIKQQLTLLLVENDVQVEITTEVALGESNSVALTSSLSHELVFTSSHAVHHYALMSVIAKLHGVNVDSNLGVAAATASHQRQLAANG